MAKTNPVGKATSPSASPPDHFEYSQLEPGTTRLLDVLPGSGHEKLSCRVTSASLSQPPSFYALSYTWVNDQDGSHPAASAKIANATETIYLNEQPYLVSPNLLSALRFYRANYTKPLWVDFLCINQFNLPERGSQVLCMRQIFSSCQRLLVWLGDEANDSGIAVDFLEEVAQLPDITNSAAFIVRIILAKTHLRKWKALEAFWKRPYWMRTWVIQEQAVVASNKIDVACGSRRFRWDLLYRLNDALKLATSSGRINECMEIVRQDKIRFCGNILHHLLTVRRLQDLTANGQRLPLLSVLDCTRRAHASEDRDKIYGILSFVKDQEKLVPKPDYVCRIQQVYKSLTLAYIAHYKNLDILVQASSRRKLRDLPSWTPDWSVDQRISRLNRSHSHSGFFHAAGNTSATIIPSPDDNILICEGFQVDTLDGLGDSLTKRTAETECLNPKNKTTMYGDASAICSALWRSLLSDITFLQSSFERAPASMGPLFVKKCRDYENVFLNEDHPIYRPDKPLHPDYSIFEVWYRENRSFEVAGKPIWEWVLGQPEPEQLHHGDSSLDASFERTMRKKLYGRRLMTTQTGYIGLAPIASRRLDKVCILFGCSTPVILRPLGDGHFKFIGECYVHGLMEGEAMAMAGDGRSTEPMTSSTKPPSTKEPIPEQGPSSPKPNAPEKQSSRSPENKPLTPRLRSSSLASKTSLAEDDVCANDDEVLSEWGGMIGTDLQGQDPFLLTNPLPEAPSEPPSQTEIEAVAETGAGTGGAQPPLAASAPASAAKSTAMSLVREEFHLL